MILRLKDMRDIIATWDDNLTSSNVIKEIQKLNPVNHLNGVMCWNCGTENRKSNKVCNKCRDHLD